MFPRVILVALAAMLGVEHAHGLVALCDVGHERNPLLCLRYTNRWRRLTMTTIRSTRLGVLLSIAVFAGLGSTGAQAYDPIVRDHRTPRPIVRDHRTSGPFVPDNWTPGPIVRDHRTPGPIVRDHRTSGHFVPDNWTPGPIVRDHRTPGPVVRDHRGQNGAPQGGVTVTSSTRQRGSTPCIRNILGGPCIGLGWR